jgi:hypothetical protein
MEAIGFSVMLFFVWATEALAIPHHFFGEPPGFLWTRVIFRSVIILSIWAWVHFTTRRLIKRLHYLEEYLLVCGWCRKVGHQGEWLTMESFFGARLNAETSHGICPECSAKQLLAHRTVTRVDKPPA